MKLSCHTITWGGVVGHPVGVTSVKDLFYRANAPSEPALRDVAAAGYAGVELFDGNLMEYEDRPDDLEQLLAETGLQLVAVYSGANFIFPEILEEELCLTRRDLRDLPVLSRRVVEHGPEAPRFVRESPGGAP